MATIADTYAEIATNLGEQMQAVGEEPALLFDQEWIITTATFVAAMRVNNDNVRALQPPAPFATVHTFMLQAADHYDVAMDALVEGIDNLEASLIEKMAQELVLGNQAVTDAAQAGNDVRATRVAEANQRPTNTSVPLPTNTLAPLPTNTLAPQPTSTPAPLPTALPPTAVPEPTQPPAPSPASVIIVAVNKSAEFVDIQNVGGTDQDLAGWVLVSELGNQTCGLGGVLSAGQTLRIYALAEDTHLGGFNCGFGTNIWNNSESDPAALYDANGNLVDRR